MTMLTDAGAQHNQNYTYLVILHDNLIANREQGEGTGLIILAAAYTSVGATCSIQPQQGADS